MCGHGWGKFNNAQIIIYAQFTIFRKISPHSLIVTYPSRACWADTQRITSACSCDLKRYRRAPKSLELSGGIVTVARELSTKVKTLFSIETNFGKRNK